MNSDYRNRHTDHKIHERDRLRIQYEQKKKANEWAPVNGIVVRKYIFFYEAFKVCRHVYLATRSAAPSSSQQKNLV